MRKSGMRKAEEKRIDVYKRQAEALGKHFASDVFESYSAGTETKEQINQDAVRLMKKKKLKSI